MIKKLISRKNIFIVSMIIFSILGVGGYFTYNYDVTKIQEATMKYWEQGDSRRGGYVIQNSTKENRPKQFVLTKYDIMNPVTTVVLLEQTLPSGKVDIDWETFYLKRQGLGEFTVQESIISYSTNYTFDEAIELAKKYDVFKQNPDKTNIVNDPGLNLPPDKLQKVLSDQAKEKDSIDKTAAFNKLTPAEKNKFCEDNLAIDKNNYEKYLKQQQNGDTSITDSDLAGLKKYIGLVRCEY